MNKLTVKFAAVAIFILSVGTTLAYAQDDSVTLDSLSSELTIYSEGIKSYGNEKKMVFVDNVVVMSDNFTLTADTMSVYFKS
ncbi:MAG: hypothetical protein IJD28_00725, partial [Deferribacterales bacterium]|nr:hypothetical protein [Deferribacterales bacterium]